MEPETLGFGGIVTCIDVQTSFVQWVRGGSWINGGAEMWDRTGDHRFWRDWLVYRCPNLRLSSAWSSTQVNKEQGYCMASEIIISVAYKPLLVYACESLGFAPPLFICSDDATNNFSVVVALNHEPAAYKFFGGPMSTKDESCEIACRKMLIHLMVVHGLCVLDVSLTKKDKAERSLALFVLKRKYYADMEQGNPPSSLSSAYLKDRIHSSACCVELDFYRVLGGISDRFDVHVTPIEYFELGFGDHVAWLIVTCPGKLSDREVVISDRSSSEYAANQSLAEKAIHFLMPIYNFVVEDVNFHLLQQPRFALKLERQAYYSLKDRIYGPVHRGQPQPFLDEELPTTPRCPSSRIPQGLPPPIPPKKRLRHAL